MATDTTGIYSLDTKKIMEAVDAVTTAVDAQKVTWTENQALSFDDATPAKTVEGVAIIDLAANEYKKVVVQIKIVFGDSADGNAEIRIRKSADSGTTKDTILAAGSTEITFEVSGTKTITLEFNEIPWVQIGVYNGNSASQDITISGIYAGLKYAA